MDILNPTTYKDLVSALKEDNITYDLSHYGSVSSVIEDKKFQNGCSLRVLRYDDGARMRNIYCHISKDSYGHEIVKFSVAGPELFSTSRWYYYGNLLKLISSPDTRENDRLACAMLNVMK